MTQTILGGGGTIGILLAKELTAYTDKIRIVSRNPKKVNPTDELVACDLLSQKEVEKAVEGSAVVYLTVGLEYKAKVWQRDWPTIMRNTIEACKAANARLVFFDNIYMYSPHHLNMMDEQTPIDPVSQKGKVRAEIARTLMEKVKAGELEATIARSADFYGPGVGKNGMLRQMVVENLAKGKKANWMGKLDCKHSFTYTVDAAKATALLGNSDKAYGEVWHLPTAKNPPTGQEWIDMYARAMGREGKVQVAGKFMVKTMGIFMSIMREMVEMYYQYDRDYVFNSDKIEKAFGIRPTSYGDGVLEVVREISV
ncbi:NAD-dependent epimerase/dehydratase family protein [Cryomorpha ignava]|uniref:NAD-dependent epimerase/dehydratase family protein n=1 Tax=Cryomorpha ignava TaxID=101383 RepID=A0A7K3WSZ8_9FLAO|nr:NAD-dependent epimerase/dehydratase family protein [Cryomorpha ignava]NEN24614.1 NAD-dependent epimerase/dehydratase family protein [Cryomorpha ignava]